MSDFNDKKGKGTGKASVKRSDATRSDADKTKGDEPRGEAKGVAGPGKRPAPHQKQGSN